MVQESTLTCSKCGCSWLISGLSFSRYKPAGVNGVAPIQISDSFPVLLCASCNQVVFIPFTKEEVGYKVKGLDQEKIYEIAKQEILQCSQYIPISEAVAEQKEVVNSFTIQISTGVTR